MPRKQLELHVLDRTFSLLNTGVFSWELNYILGIKEHKLSQVKAYNIKHKIPLTHTNFKILHENSNLLGSIHDEF